MALEILIWVAAVAVIINLVLFLLFLIFLYRAGRKGDQMVEVREQWKVQNEHMEEQMRLLTRIADKVAPDD